MIQIGIDYYPEQWDRSLWEPDVSAMERLGVDVVRIGEFAWGALEPQDGRFEFGWLDDAIALIASHGMRVILGTPTNCAPTWLYRDHPDTVQWDRDGRQSHLGIRGHRCQESETFRAYAERIVRKMAERYAGHPEIAAWQIDNEIEINHCTCPTCTARFREWLQNRYETIDALNEAWGTEVWSGQYGDWSQVTPPLMRQGYHTDWYNPASLLDYERFAAASTAGFVDFQVDLIHEYDPDAVTTTNACFAGDSMPGFHSEFKSLSVASYDNYPPVVIPDDREELYSNAFGLDFVRGFKRSNFWIMEELGGQMGCWGPISPALAPGMLEGYALQAVAHGADLLSFFRWRTASTGAEMFCHGLLDHANIPNSRTRALEGLIKRLATIPGLADTQPRSQVAILYGADQEFSFRNQRQSDGFGYWTQMRLFHEACMNLGVSVDVIEQTSELDGYDVVIAPTMFVTDDDVAAGLERFAEAGGTVVLTDRSGVKDMNGNCIVGEALPTRFSEMCGCHVLEYDPIGKRERGLQVVGGGRRAITSWCDLIETDGADVWANYSDGPYAGTPAITRNDRGSGRIYYVGTVGEKSLYRDLMKEIFRNLGLPHLEDLPLGVEACGREGAGGSFLFVFNNTMDPVDFLTGEGRIELAPLEVKIRTNDGWM